MHIVVTISNNLAVCKRVRLLTLRGQFNRGANADIGSDGVDWSRARARHVVSQLEEVMSDAQLARNRQLRRLIMADAEGFGTSPLFPALLSYVESGHSQRGCCTGHRWSSTDGITRA